MPLRTYQFCYSIDGILTELPTYITVRAKNMRRAKRAAEIRLKEIVRGYTEGKWEYVKSSLDGEWKPRYVPGWFTRGHLYPGVEIKPRKPWTPEQREKHNREMEGLFSQWGGRDKLFAPIRDIIENAPVITELFKTSTYELTDSAPSIPLEFVSPMPRHLWPRRRRG